MDAEKVRPNPRGCDISRIVRVRHRLGLRMQPHTQSLGQANPWQLLRPRCLLVRLRRLQHHLRSHHHHHADAGDLEAATQMDAKAVSGGRLPFGMVRRRHQHHANRLTARFGQIKRTNMSAPSLPPRTNAIASVC